MMREQYRTGLDYLRDVTTLLHRVRSAHPVNGLYEAGDLNWWWRTPRSTDKHQQLFWFDDEDRPEAAMILTQWSERIALDPIVMPAAAPDWIAEVIERGLAHAAESGFGELAIMVDCRDGVLQQVLSGHGFVADKSAAGDVEAWLVADARPQVSQLHEGYRLFNRLGVPAQAHHMVRRNGPDVELRLRQTSLYRPQFDLVVLDGRETVAGYGLFWLHPQTSTGLVEPIRTDENHQRRGIARHILTMGIGLLADAGAERIKIVFEPDNSASQRLYRSVGFECMKKTAVFTGRVLPEAS